MRLRNRRWMPPRMGRPYGVLESSAPPRLYRVAALFHGSAILQEIGRCAICVKAQGAKAPDIQHPLPLPREGVAQIPPLSALSRPGRRGRFGYGSELPWLRSRSVPAVAAGSARLVG